MDAARIPQLTEDEPETAPESAGPVSEIHAKIASAFAEPAPDAPAAVSHYGEVSNRFAGAAERHAEAVALSQQADREEMAMLRQALSELCEGTAAISAHTTQRFAAIFGAMLDSDDRLVALAEGQTTHAEHLDATGKSLTETENRLTVLAEGHAAREKNLAMLASSHAAQAAELETLQAKLKDTQTKLEDTGAILEQSGRLIEAAEARAGRTDASILTLQEDHQNAAVRQNEIQTAIGRLEETLAGFDRRQGRLIEAAEDRAGQTDACILALQEDHQNAAARQNDIQAAIGRLEGMLTGLERRHGKLIEAAEDRASQTDASIQALQEHHESTAARQDDLHAAVGRLEEMLAGLDQQLESLGGVAGPIAALRGQQAELASQQRTQGQTVELVLDHTQAARQRDAKLEERITAAEERLTASIERLEAICTWQSRLGQVLTAGPGG